MTTVICEKCGAKFDTALWENGKVTRDCCPSEYCNNTTAFKFMVK